MGNVIGVLHLDRNLKKLIEFVDSEYGTPKSLMLELPPDWRDHKDRLFASKYFSALADEYEKRGTEIIAGDTNRYVVEYRYPQWFLDFDEKLRKKEWNPETLTEWTKGFLSLLKEFARHSIATQWNSLSSSKGEVRNRGFLDMYDQTSPELTIVGAVHSDYLKGQRPDTDYAFFMTDTFVERTAFTLHRILGYAKADSYAILSP